MITENDQSDSQEKDNQNLELLPYKKNVSFKWKN